MTVLYMILFIISAACFVAAMFRVGTTRLNLQAAGLLAWVLVPLIQTIRHLT